MIVSNTLLKGDENNHTQINENDFEEINQEISKAWTEMDTVDLEKNAKEAEEHQIHNNSILDLSMLDLSEKSFSNHSNKTFEEFLSNPFFNERKLSKDSGSEKDMSHENFSYSISRNLENGKCHERNKNTPSLGIGNFNNINININYNKVHYHYPNKEFNEKNNNDYSSYNYNSNKNGNNSFSDSPHCFVKTDYSKMNSGNTLINGQNRNKTIPNEEDNTNVNVNNIISSITSSSNHSHKKDSDNCPTYKPDENSNKYSQRKKDSLDLPKNTIHWDNVLKLKDKRTTIMIRHIPNKYSLELLMEEINAFFNNKYNLLYLPIDYANNSNWGFAFINLIEPMHVILFFDELYGKKWNYFHSNKRCQLAYAKIQGEQEWIEYIKKKIDCSQSNIQSNWTLSAGLKNIFSKSCFMTNIDPLNKGKMEIELPMKYYNVFLNYYPYSVLRKKTSSIFVVESYYNF